MPRSSHPSVKRRKVIDVDLNTPNRYSDEEFSVYEASDDFVNSSLRMEVDQMITAADLSNIMMENNSSTQICASVEEYDELECIKKEVENTRSSRRKRSRKRYSDSWMSDCGSEIEDGNDEPGFVIENKLNDDRFSINEFVKEMYGHDFNLVYLKDNGFDAPILFKETDGLGLKVPDRDVFSVDDIRNCVGSRRMVDVIDVESQKSFEMSMKEFQRYYDNSERTKLLNVISLEFSLTKLDKLVESPIMVRQIDWVDTVWPKDLKLKQKTSTNELDQMFYPKVQKYVLMSVKNCYTDFHIDFGGSSVWYHILKGEKVFWLIPPTKENFNAYKKWVLSGKQSEVFFGDVVEKCQRISLYSGNTFLMPSGWIHAVFTSKDSIVFGGNFLNDFNVEKQIEVVKLEDQIRVQDKFRFPFFNKMLWYVLEKYCYQIGKTPENPDHLQTGQPSKVRKSRPIQPEFDGNLSITPDENSFDRIKPNILNSIIAIAEYLVNIPTDERNVPDLKLDPRIIITQITKFIEGKLPATIKISPGVLDGKKSKADRKKRTCNHSKYESKKVETRKGISQNRRIRCKRCEACLNNNCGSCTRCKDMRKFGGPGLIKQCCVFRQCLRPQLPMKSSCTVCRSNRSESKHLITPEKVAEELKDGKAPNSGFDEKQMSGLNFGALMECNYCMEIIHPACYSIKKPGIVIDNGDKYVSDHLPNSWTCPCCYEKLGGKYHNQKYLKAKRNASSTNVPFGKSSHLGDSDNCSNTEIKTEPDCDTKTCSDFNVKTDFYEESIIETDFNEESTIETDFNEDSTIKTDINEDAASSNCLVDDKIKVEDIGVMRSETNFDNKYNFGVIFSNDCSKFPTTMEIDPLKQFDLPFQ